MRAAGYTDTITGIDGVDNWDEIVNKSNSSREEFVYNIDDVKNTSAIRYLKYKLINNKPGKPGVCQYVCVRACVRACVCVCVCVCVCA